MGCEYPDKNFRRFLRYLTWKLQYRAGTCKTVQYFASEAFSFFEHGENNWSISRIITYTRIRSFSCSKKD